MVSAIRIYIEGGGNNNLTRIKMRTGFHYFLKELRDIARSKSIKLDVLPCGNRDAAYDDFCRALKTYSKAFNILLVDSEVSVPAGKTQWQHLKDLNNKWECPPGVSDNQCFLMIESMETWLIADMKALKEFYGQGFLPNAIPKAADIESINKKSLLDALEHATVNTKTKG